MVRCAVLVGAGLLLAMACGKVDHEDDPGVVGYGSGSVPNGGCHSIVKSTGGTTPAGTGGVAAGRGGGGSALPDASVPGAAGETSGMSGGAPSVGNAGAAGEGNDDAGATWPCTAGRASCDGDDANGCETDLKTNILHCGQCGNICPNDGWSGTPFCYEGLCPPVECGSSMFGDCDGIVENGCETNLSTDANHCGVCGNVCEAGTCANGFCS